MNNATTFASWFSNCNAATPNSTCVNQQNVNINATVDTVTGKLSYNNSAFFPLDSITGTTNDGDQFNEHNYFFTAQFGLDLIYDPNLTNTFSFTGDDDVWVFINNKLVLDLGGVHAAATKGFDMNTVASQQGIQAGQLYKFDFFFAERHYSQSNVNIESYLGAPVMNVPEPSSLALLSLSILGLAGAARRRRV
ncbi:MAG: fibro-slime domain-containing protein [Rheinheimera sp.]|nr:MAG: fibro-slime domain-containing protein [Rheinheimera sp.]